MLNYSYGELDSQTIKAKIAGRLHKERVDAGLSLDALSEKIGYSKPTVQSWEKGWKDGSGKNHIPSLEQLLDLAALYNCTPEYMLCEYDSKTKEATDISLETGLSQENITRLQRMFSAILENPNGGKGANDLFLSFLNYFIKNSTLIFELLFNRQMIEVTRYEFENDSDYEELLTAYTAVGAVGINSEIFKDNLFSQVTVIGQYTMPLLEYFEALGYDKDHIHHLMEKVAYYRDVMSLTKFKQSDFALSDSFLDIVKSFFREYPDIIYVYNAFADEQRVHISPERIKPIPTIRASED